jgi:hypothetical protein
MKLQPLPEVILGFPKKHDDRVAAGDAVIAAVDGNTNFPNAAAAVVAAKATIKPYKNAIADAKAKVHGAVKVRREARIAFDKAFEPVRAQIQIAVDAHVDQAATLAESAKMKLRKLPTHSKQDFAVKDGPLSGQVKLIAKAILRALLYFWEFSLDQKTWSTAPDTSKAKTILAGLTVGQTYYFRFRARTRTGMTDYSQILSLMIR